MIRPPTLFEFPRYPVTAGLCLLSIAVSGAWWTGHPINPLLMSVAMLDGELWRLVTSVLPHVNFFHLFFNLSWVWYFGTLLERTWGGFATLALVVTLAVASMGSEYAVMKGGVGLSGIGYGFWALAAVLAKHDERFLGAVDKRTNVMFGVWFAFCIVATAFDVMRVANLAHGVGALTGWLIGSAVVLPKRRIVNVFGAMSVTAFALLGATIWRPYVTFVHDDHEESQACIDAIEANQLDRAHRLCALALKINPKDDVVSWNLGVIEANQGKDTEAARKVSSGTASP
ncbi:MAG: rhomboid family intramembrane serine protease [Clostridia bacterium]|nr:rhomboid family intramembrane serine protease [Deltaproteobacteria bacterium]